MSGIIAAAFAGGRDAELVLDISNTVNPNISALLSAAGWNNRAPVRLVVAPSAKVNQLVVPEIDYPQGLSLMVGAGALMSSYTAAVIRTRRPIAITNLGSIHAPGGSGGDGASVWVQKNSGPDAGVPQWGYGGTGGAGQRMASGGLTVQAAQVGSAGSTGTAASSGFGGDYPAYAYGGYGGGGGAFGQSGSAGSGGTVSGGYSAASGNVAGFSGNLPGIYIDGDAYVTWVNKGDVKGRAV